MRAFIIVKGTLLFISVYVWNQRSGNKWILHLMALEICHSHHFSHTQKKVFPSLTEECIFKALWQIMLLKKKKIAVELIYNIVLVSGM